MRAGSGMVDPDWAEGETSVVPLIHRRTVLGGLGAAALAPALSSPALAGIGPFTRFRHGVASGDPRHDRVIIWTRVTPRSREEDRGNLLVRWRMATDPLMTQIVGQGITAATINRDFTVKVDVERLLPDRTYYYDFRIEGTFDTSPIGRTKTFPAPGAATHRLRYAFVSCSHYNAGYFHVYRAIANRADLDVVLHLGDYIYEYGPGQFGDNQLEGRALLPEKEIVTLDDYRARYALYRTDPDLQEAHRQHPFMTVWDDHETANNAWRDGAQNHTPETEGDWTTRRAAGVRAYFEWLPIRETALPSPITNEAEAVGPDTQRIWRSARYGDLADFLMLDTRLYGRDEQVGIIGPDIGDPSRSLLGPEQEQWLTDCLIASQFSGTRWRFLGQQVMFSKLIGENVEKADIAFNADQWDGYGASQERLLDTIVSGGIENLAVLTGDIHSSWAFDVPLAPYDSDTYKRFTGEGSIAVEFVTSSVTSPSIPGVETSTVIDRLGVAAMPHLKWLNLTERGYCLVDVSHERTQCEWWFVEDVRAPSGGSEYLARAYYTDDGATRLRRSRMPSLPKPSAPPA